MPGQARLSITLCSVVEAAVKNGREELMNNSHTSKNNGHDATAKERRHNTTPTSSDTALSTSD